MSWAQPKNWLLALLGLGGLVVFWHLGIQSLAANLPLARQMAPMPAITSLLELLGSGALTQDLLASLQRVFISLGLALLIGVPLGLAVGWWASLDAFTGAAFQFLRMVSPLSWMPLAVMLLGIGDKPIYLLLTLGAVWPIILNTAQGVKNLNPNWLQLAASLSATRSELLLRFIWPGILGQLLTGLRLALGIVWVLLVPCEMLGVTSGLGYFILDTRDRLDYAELMATLVLIGILGLLLDNAAKSVQKIYATV